MSENDYGDYSVKNTKSFEGTDGYGFNADLHRSGKKVARVIDSGCGGEAMFYWEDQESDKVDIHTTDYKGKPHTYRGTPEEKLLDEQVEKQPLQDHEYSPEGLKMDMSWFVSNLVFLKEVIF